MQTIPSTSETPVVEKPLETITSLVHGPETPVEVLPSQETLRPETVTPVVEKKNDAPTLGTTAVINSDARAAKNVETSENTTLQRLADSVFTFASNLENFILNFFIPVS